MTQFRDKDALAGLLRHTLKNAGAPAGACPSPDLLGAYFERSLSPAETNHWDAHFAACLRCQEQLAALARIDSATTTSTRPAPGRVAWFLNWRWITPTAIAAVGAIAIWIVARPQISSEEVTQVARVAEPNQAPVPPKDAPATEAKNEATTKPPEAPRDTPGHAARPDPKPAPALPTPRESELLALADRTDEKKKEAGAASADQFAAKRPPDAAASTRGYIDRAESARVAAAPKADAAAMQERERDLQRQNQVLALKAPPAAAPAPSAQGLAPQQAPPVVAQSVAPPQAVEEARLAKQRAQTPSPARAAEEGLRRRTDQASRPELAAVQGRVQWRFFKDGSIERYDERLKSGETAPSPVPEEILAASAPSEKVCWAVGRGGVIIRNTGQAWERLGSPSDEDLVFIEARDALNATVRTRGGKTYITTDGARSWRTP